MSQSIERIVILKPCCIGDVIFTTPLLKALRRAYPQTQIDWIVGSSAIGAIREHPDLSHVYDSGKLANPASRLASLLNLIKQLRIGNYDLAVVPDRSPLSGLAVLLAGIPQRAGLDSAGRGFAYTVKAKIDPQQIRHEAEIYLDIARILNISTEDCWANVPLSEQAILKADKILRRAGWGDKSLRLLAVHPGGGINAGMAMTQKRWPAENFAALACRAADELYADIAVVGIESDKSAIEKFLKAVKRPVVNLMNQLSLAETAALATRALVYLGNDNGVGHLAAAAGAKVLMIFGPSDPRRYAPFVPLEQARVAWRPFELPTEGVSAGVPTDFDWARDGVSVDEAWEQLRYLV